MGNAVVLKKQKEREEMSEEFAVHLEAAFGILGERKQKR